MSCVCMCVVVCECTSWELRSGVLLPLQESKQQRNERLRANRDFEGEDEPSTSKVSLDSSVCTTSAVAGHVHLPLQLWCHCAQAQPQGLTTFSRGSSQSKPKAGIWSTLMAQLDACMLLHHKAMKQREACSQVSQNR